MRQGTILAAALIASFIIILVTPAVAQQPSLLTVPRPALTQHDWYRYQGAPDSKCTKDCGPTSVAMAIQFATGKEVRIEDIRKSMTDGRCVDTSPDDWSKVLNQDKWEVNGEETTGMSVKHREITGMEAVVRAVNDWHIVTVPVRMHIIDEGKGFYKSEEDSEDDPKYYKNRYVQLSDRYGDHVLVVKGISIENSGKWVIVYDPNVWGQSGKKYYSSNGEPKGKNRYYDYDQFEDAFEALGNKAIEVVGTPTGSGGCADHSHTGVVLFDSVDCDGSKREFSAPSGLINLSDTEWNDRTRSLHIDSGSSVKAYQHDNRGGASRCLTRSLWDRLWDLSGQRFENSDILMDEEISSIEVFANRTCSEETPVPGTRRLPDFRLPYSEDTEVYWTGGPHQWGNLDCLSNFPAGAGSGLDFANGSNFEVLAMAAGTIEDVSCGNPGFGCQVAIRHDVGGTVLVYAHLQPSSIQTLMTRFNEADQAGGSLWVPQGYALGNAGKSGKQKDIHLHIELRDGSENCYFSCLPDDLGGNPVGWGDLIPFVDGYHITSYLTRCVDAVTDDYDCAYNYDGSAVIGDVKVIYDFPYLDQPGDIERRAVVRVNSSFQCDSSSKTCEDNDQTTLTQFAEKGLIGGGQGKGYQATVVAGSPLGGQLVSSNVPTKIILGAVLHEQSEFPILEPGEETKIYFALQNIGSQTWEAGHYALVNVNGISLGARPQMALNVDVPPGSPVFWHFTITAPVMPGVYRTEWRFSYDGHLFGSPLLWTDVIVIPGGSDDLAEIIRRLIEEAREDAEDWIEEQWEELRRQIIKMIEAEIRRRIEEFLSELCGGSVATAILCLSVLWFGHRCSGAENREH